ncbi:GRAS domain-containing protein [Psidium guajava]|nr:GRAS domain-containing protein [Psidium guajava]
MLFTIPYRVQIFGRISRWKRHGVVLDGEIGGLLYVWMGILT